MSDVAVLVTSNLDTWTSAVERKSRSGRGPFKKISLYGIERLRALILDLALRGQLVPQDADDEPASKLLDRISRARKAFDPKFKVPNLSETEVGEANVPTNWERVCLAELAKPQAGFAFKSKFFNEAGDGLALIRIRDVGQPFTGTYYSGEYRPEFEVEFGDYLISMDGEFRVATWEGDKALLNQRVTRLQFFETDLERSFVAIALQQELTKLQGVKAYTTVDHLSGKQIAASQIPVPPLAEQKRIVAKVDELMALCDALERESEDALTAHQMLVETLLATLVTSTDAADRAKNWARLEKHFDTVFTTEGSVEELKKTILELAVSGKLLPTSQDPKPGKLSDLGEWAGGNGFPKKFQGKAEGEVPFLKVSDMNLPGNERQITCANNRVSSEEIVEMRAKLHPPGTVIFPKIGGAIATNKRRILSEPSAIDNNCAGQVPAAGIDTDWLFIVLSSIDMAIYQAGTSVPAVNMKRLANHSVTITAEVDQKRIVAEVNKLMKFCEQLKSHLADATETQRHLADAIVERAAA